MMGNEKMRKMVTTLTDTTAAEISERQEAIAAYICQMVGAADVAIDVLQRLSGGAIQENWLVGVRIAGGSWEGRHQWVLRTDAPSSVALSLNRAQEYAVLRVAYDAGAKAPKVLWLCRDASVIGRDFYLMECIQGVASAHRVTGDPTLVPDRCALLEELGATLARLHSVTPPRADLEFLPRPREHPALESIAAYRAYLDTLAEPFPVLEWGLRWCELNLPASVGVNLIHRDYRTGNYMICDGKLTGILDWEFAGWGDPREDVGWFAAKCWRSSRRDREAGGIGEVADFLRGYRAVSGRTLTRQELTYWQVMAHLRWSVIALQQAQRHLSGQQKSLELALTGRLIPELEYEILALTKGKHDE